MINGNPQYIKLFDSRNSHDKNEFPNKITNKNNIIIIMKIDNEIKLGGFLYYKIPNSFNQTVHNKDNRAFLFSLSFLEVNQIKKDYNAFWYEQNIFFAFGTTDLVIALNFFEENANTSIFPGSYNGYLGYDKGRITN